MGVLNSMANGSTARKIQLSAHDLDLADVSHALSTDETRSHLCKPYGFEFNGVGYIAATDGHRMAMLRSEHWLDHVRHDSPPAQHLLDKAFGAKHLGSILAVSLDDAAALPRKWDIGITLWSDRDPSLRITVTKGSGRKQKHLHPLGNELLVPWSGVRLERLREPLGMTLPYLIEAVEFAGTGSVDVFGAGPLDPIVVVPHGSTPATAKRLEIVSPRRV
jgi:hypothetical protein